MPATISIAKSKVEISPVAKADLNGSPKRTIFSFQEYCPNDHKYCRMSNLAHQQMGKPLGFGSCSLEGYTKFRVSCRNCREELATVYGREANLEDWRRLRYVSWHDDKNWYGLLGLNIDIKTSQIRIECTCDPTVRKPVEDLKVEEIS